MNVGKGEGVNVERCMAHGNGCSGVERRPLTRRELLWQAGGLGGIALAALLDHDPAVASPQHSTLNTQHFPARAKRVVQIFLAGGVSHVDTFDFKPELERADGKPLSGKGTVDTFFQQPGNLMKSVFPFRQRGKSGLWISDLLPHLASCADDLTLIHSMVGKTSNHTPATFMMNSGFSLNGFPSMGSWVTYGLGSMNDGLPSFVVLPDPRQLPAGGSINWTAGFLPASHQGVALRTQGDPILDLFPSEKVADGDEAASRRLLSEIERDFMKRAGEESALTARIRSYELAARMQMSVPEVTRLEEEPAETRALYGMDRPEAAAFGRNCLLARRLLERGVRFVQLYHGGAFGSPRINWDGHEEVRKNHTEQAASMDQPVAGLLKDLKRRGMLEDTLVVWCTEFGRTPFTQGIGTTGRDHHERVFTCWLAGAGVKPGFAYGESDEVGYGPGKDPVTIHDFHATILHLLGMDHRRLTFYHNGIRRRLTDVSGEVVGGVLA
jgi:hypothetical protein